MTVHIHLDAEPGSPEAGKQLRDACQTILQAGNEHYAREQAKREAKKAVKHDYADTHQN